MSFLLSFLVFHAYSIRGECGNSILIIPEDNDTIPSYKYYECSTFEGPLNIYI